MFSFVIVKVIFVVWVLWLFVFVWVGIYYLVVCFMGLCMMLGIVFLFMIMMLGLGVIFVIDGVVGVLCIIVVI